MSGEGSSFTIGLPKNAGGLVAMVMVVFFKGLRLTEKFPPFKSI